MEQRTLMNFRFAFDFGRDTNRFFDTTAKRDMLTMAGRLLTDRLDDNLAAITPSGTNTWEAKFTHPATGTATALKNLAIPAGTILIYAGGRDLASGTLASGGSLGRSSFGTPAWNASVTTRGQSGAGTAVKTDVSPWGGSITFDTSGVNWFFGKTTNGLKSGMSDFLSVAVHELTHVLGINSGNESWTRLISSGKFTGASSRAANNNQTVPVDSGRGHWANGVKSDGVETAMDPSLTSGTRKLFSRLDFAGLKDIGWSVDTSDGTLYSAPHVLTEIPTPGLGTGGGTVFNGGIGSSDDVDFYRVYIGAGATLSTTVRTRKGGKSVDTYLRVYDLSGAVLATGDQGGIGGTDSITSLRVARSDYYYVAVSSYANRSYNPTVFNSGPGGTTGDYTISISADS